MRIACLTNSPLDPSLGSGKTVLAWSEGLRRLGHEVDVLAPDSFYRPWPGEKAKRLKMRIDPLRLMPRLLSGRYELVEFYGAEFGPLIGRLARRPRLERPFLVAHTNGLELLADAAQARDAEATKEGALKRLAGGLLQPWIRQANLRAFSRVDAFAAICQMDLDHVVAHKIQPPERCAVVEPGIDEPFLKAPWDRPKVHRLVSLGTWTSRKDPLTLVTVAARVMEADGEVEFHMLGAGDARQLILNHLPRALHPRTVIHPVLSQAEMVDILSQSKVFLFPSLYEGFGMAVTEAMACGCAVVVTPTGFGASIKNAEEGVVCDFRDVAAMTTAATRLLRDDVGRLRLAAKGRGRVSCLAWSEQVRKLESVYRRWLVD
jgi:glycosyltransferase involved in cell wall biosynthesis